MAGSGLAVGGLDGVAGPTREAGNAAPSDCDAHVMKSTRMAAVASLAVSAGLIGLAVASPAAADPDESFLDWLAEAGITDIDPATAVEVGRQVCPMLAEPGQRVADVAAEVADAIGRPLGPSTMFTGLAINLFCPGVVESLTDGQSPIPLGLLGR